MGKIVIIGAGMMGGAMAMVASDAGHSVDLVGAQHDDAIVKDIQANNGRHKKLGARLGAGVRCFPATALAERMETPPDLVILAVAAAGIDWAVTRLAKAIRSPVPILITAKGLKVVEDVIAILPDVVASGIAERNGIKLPVLAIAGPCLARELAARRATGAVITGTDLDAAERVNTLLRTRYWQPRINPDVRGVEVCAAFKNIFAIGVAWMQGRLELEGRSSNGALMHNPAALLFAQAISEMAILVEATGGDPTTASGLAGAGDLYITCQGGRHGRLGQFLGMGITCQAARTDQMPGETVEGADMAIALGPLLQRMLTDGRLPAERLPFFSNLVKALWKDLPLVIDPSEMLAI